MAQSKEKTGSYFEQDIPYIYIYDDIFMYEV